jgi:hypothetical protein
MPQEIFASLMIPSALAIPPATFEAAVSNLKSSLTIANFSESAKDSATSVTFF